MTAIESSPKYLDAVRELLGLESAKDVPTPSVPVHREQLMTGEMVEPAESTVCWWATPLHAGQGRADAHYEVSIRGSMLGKPTRGSMVAVKSLSWTTR